MNSYKLLLTIGCIWLLVTGCTTHYPENMSRAERKSYYELYNLAYAGNKTAVSSKPAASQVQKNPEREETEKVHISIPFSIRNNSLLPQKIEIDGNILTFKPLEVRYVGFAVGTKAYLYQKQNKNARGTILFEVTQNDTDKRFRIFN